MSPVWALTHPTAPPPHRTGLEFSGSSETRSWGTLHAFAPHFPVPEHTWEDKSSLIQRWDEWQHCFWVSVGRKEGMPGPRAQLHSAHRLAQCCCCRTRGRDKNTHTRSWRTGERVVMYNITVWWPCCTFALRSVNSSALVNI